MADNSQNNKRIAKNTVVLYIRLILTILIGLYTSRVVLQILGVEDFGIYNVVGGIVSIFVVINSAMANSTSRNLTYYVGKGDQNTLKMCFGVSLTIHVTIACIIMVLGEIFGLYFLHHELIIPQERFQAAKIVFHLSIASTFFSIMIVPYNAAIIAHEKMTAFAYIAIAEVLLKLGIVIFLTFFDYDKLIVYGILMLIVQFVLMIVYMAYCLNHFHETRTTFGFDKKLRKSMVSFAGWSLIGNIANIATTQGLNVVLNMFFDPTINAARGIAVQIQSLVTRFIMGFLSAINPQITKSYVRKDYEYMTQLMYSSSKYCFYLIFFCSLPFLLEASSILKLWLNVVPNYSVEFFRLIIIACMIEILANPINIAIEATGQIRTFQLLTSGVLFLVLPVSYLSLWFGGNPLVPFYINLTFVSITFAIRLAIAHHIIHFNIKQYIRLIISRIAFVGLSSSVCGILIHHIIYSNSIWSSLLSCTISEVLCFIIIFFGGLKKNEREFVKRRIKTLGKFHYDFQKE